MGGLYPKMKITALTMLMGVLAIAGVPLFSGWYSKDAVLAYSLGFCEVHPQHMLLFILPLATAGITTFYMFRMWFLTFAGKPRDHHVYEHAHESPWVMTVPLILLAILSVCVAWGWPVWDPEASALEQTLHHAQPFAVTADHAQEHLIAHEVHSMAGTFALGVVVLGFAFAWVLYYKRWLDPEEGKQQFSGLYNFLQHKWYFDELYSIMLVRPGIRVAGWCRTFDTRVIDGFIHGLAWLGMLGSRLSGLFDKGVIDGFVNVMAGVWYGIGNWLRAVQTGFLRSYVLFMVLAAVGIWLLLMMFLGGTVAGAP
jgi:NADH-quinone oxidoreductase subunit L